MKVFNAILGIFAIFAAIYCIWFPGVFFLESGWIVTMLLAAWGACALFEAISKRATKKTEGKWTFVSAILAILGAIAAAIICLLAISRPRLSLTLDLAVLIVFVTWMIVSGILSIINAVTVGKKAEGKKWIWGLVLGILSVLAGLYGIFHILVLAKTIGLLLGALMMVYGIRLLSSLFE